MERQICHGRRWRFCVKVGFLEGAGSTDGVDFIVKFHEEGVETPQTLISIGTLDDGHLDEEVFSLSDFIGKVGSFILYVDARDSSGRDWAVWALNAKKNG